MVKGEFIKSRSNEAGRTFEMVFEQSSGFDNVLSNLVNFKELGLLKGSPRAYYLEKLPEVKFTLKTFKEKYNENEKLRKAVADLIKENYVKFIPNSSLYIDKNLDNNEEVIDEVEEDIELIKCIDKENDVWEGSDGKFYTSEGEEVEYEE
jgi:hypothetical protein